MNTVSAVNVAQGVDALNAVYADMDRAPWCIARAARNDLLLNPRI